MSHVLHSIFKHRALLGVSLFLISELAYAQAVKIDVTKQSAEISCPAMAYFSNLKVDVKVSRDPHSGEYLYRYTMTPSSTDTQRPMFFALRDLAGFNVSMESGFDGWQNCHYSDARYGGTPVISCINIPPKLPQAGGAYTGLLIRSKASPGIVWYQIEAASVPTDWTLQSLVKDLLPYYQGKAGLISEAIQEQVGEECPSGAVSKDTDRDMTGITLGPSDIAQVDVVHSDDVVNARLASANLRLAIHEPSTVSLTDAQAVTARLANVDLSSIHIEDSAGNVLKPAEGTMQALAKETRASFVLDVGIAENKLPCNIKGLIVDGKLNDGKPFRGGIAVNTPTCQRGATGTFHLTLPKPGEVLQYSGDEGGLMSADNLPSSLAGHWYLKLLALNKSLSAVCLLVASMSVASICQGSVARTVGIDHHSRGDQTKVILRKCKSQLAMKFPRWRLAMGIDMGSVDSSVPRKSRLWTFVLADFNGDGRDDVAFLFQKIPVRRLYWGDFESDQDNRAWVAVCLSSDVSDYTLHVIDGHCSDALELILRGGPHYRDFSDENTKSWFEFPAIRAYCGDEADEIYEFDGKEFRTYDLTE